MKKIAVPFELKGCHEDYFLKITRRKTPTRLFVLYLVRSSNWFSEGSMKTNLPIQLEELGAR